MPGDNSQTNGLAGEGDAPSDPQDACISRAIYESEDQGEVDIEAFDEDGTARRYEGRLRHLLHEAEHGEPVAGHRGQQADAQQLRRCSAQGGTDYVPGNPWDASKDAANNTTDWNVSKDLLVRGRVSGWFLNSNPSGRARDDSNPQNVLPADRWVMPDDWVNIAGGNVLAGSFRPSYDLMFAPNNTVGLSLLKPTGLTATAQRRRGRHGGWLDDDSTGRELDCRPHDWLQR